MTIEKSQKLYPILIQGKYVNKLLYLKKEKRYQTNELYTEIELYFKEYKDLYENLGYILTKGKEYYYLISIETNNTLKQNQLKEYISILCIIRYLQQNKIDIKILLEEDKGIDISLIKNIYTDNKLEQLLIMSEISNEKTLIDFLIKKQIVEINENDRYILTNVGKDLIEILKNEGKEFYENEEKII